MSASRVRELEHMATTKLLDKVFKVKSDAGEEVGAKRRNMAKKSRQYECWVSLTVLSCTYQHVVLLVSQSSQATEHKKY